LVNGYKEVWIDQGNGLERTKLSFLNEESVRSLAQQLALSTGRRLDQSQPYVDAQLSKTIRLHAILSPVSNPGSIISLRIHRPEVLSFNNLVESLTITKHQKDFFEKLIKNDKSFVVSGGTGSGKTTLLNSLLSICDENQHADCSCALNRLANYRIHVMTYPQPLVIPRNKNILPTDRRIVAFCYPSIHQIGD
jgi:pilus assembly protein CpaF